MRVYKLTISQLETDHFHYWYSSEAKAKRAVAEYRRENPDEPDCSGEIPVMNETKFVIKKHEIPTNKAGLIRWLNGNVFRG